MRLIRGGRHREQGAHHPCPPLHVDAAAQVRLPPAATLFEVGGDQGGTYHAVIGDQYQSGLIRARSSVRTAVLKRSDRGTRRSGATTLCLECRRAVGPPRNAATPSDMQVLSREQKPTSKRATGCIVHNPEREPRAAAQDHAHSGAPCTTEERDVSRRLRGVPAAP